MPLLFSHTNYKSYPDSFVEKGRWDLMLRWMDSLSTRSTRDTDLSGVHDLDSWMRALHAAGHLAISSSGTTGRSSYLNMAPADRQMLKLSIRKMFEVACGLKAENQFPYFWAGPRQGWFGGVEHHRLVHALYARPGNSTTFRTRASRSRSSTGSPRSARRSWRAPPPRMSSPARSRRP